jgi:aspartate racemase
MQAASAVPVLHIVRASARKVTRNDASTRRVGVLSTEGTHRMGIYPDALQELGFDVIAPTAEDFAEFVSPGIAAVKANRVADAEAKLDAAADRLFARGAGQIIMGCTEIPLGMRLRSAREPQRIVDSTQALVDAVLEHFAGTSQPRRDSATAA